MSDIISDNNVDSLQDNRNEISFLATCPKLAAFDNSDNIILDTNAGLIFKDDREIWEYYSVLITFTFNLSDYNESNKPGVQKRHS